MWQGFVDMLISLSQSKLILRAKHRLFPSKSHDWKIQGTIQKTKSKKWMLWAQETSFHINDLLNFALEATKRFSVEK